MKRYWIFALSIAVALVFAACSDSKDSPSGNDPTDGDAPDGDNSDGDAPEDGEFVSAGSGAGDRNYDGGDELGDGDAPSEDDGDDGEREIVEADLFRVAGTYIYVLNQYRGLAIVDFSDPAKMRVVGRLALEGYPKEMFVENGVAVILLTNLIEEEGDTLRSASRVVSVDVSDAAEPAIVEQFPIAGTLNDSRLVGDVVYVVASVQPWWDWCHQPEDSDYTIEIASINIADPKNVYLADSLSFQGSGWSVYVNQNAMFVATPGWDWYGWEEGGHSEITYIDISDPAGLMAQRDTFDAAATIPDRFKMHQQGDVFAVTSVTSSWNGDTYFETFDVSNPDDVVLSARLKIMEEENLYASQYSGTRAYIVTFRNTDPLFVVDFADAKNPAVLGTLEIPGWSTHLEIRGTRLYGVGVDNSDNWKTKVALFDVADPTAPTQLSMVTLGEGYSWSEALYDWKAFKVYDELGLILVPTSGWDGNWYAYVNQLNLIGIEGDALVKHGAVVSDTAVRRGFVAGDYLASLSETKLQLIDHSDLDKPKVVAEARLASYVNSLSKCGAAICDTSDGWGGNLRLRQFDAENPSDTPIWESDILDQANSWGAGAIHNESGRVYVFAENYGWWYGEDMAGDRAFSGYGEEEGGRKIHAFDFSNPAAPVFLGTATLPANQNGYYYYYGDTQGFLAGDVFYSLAETEWQEDGSVLYGLDFFDLSDLENARKTDHVGDLSPLFGYSYYAQTQAVEDGAAVWAPDCDLFGDDGDGRRLLKCYAVKLDASDPAAVRETARINIPGQLIGLSADKRRIASIDRQYIPSTEPDYTGCSLSLEILSHDGERATRLASIPLTEDMYCWWNGSYSDGDTVEPDEPPRTDGDETEPVDGDVAVDGDSSGGGDTPPEPELAAKLAATDAEGAPEEQPFYFAGAQIDGDRIYVVRQQSYWGYYEDGGVVSDDECGYYGYDYEATMKVEIYSLTTGDLERTVALDGADSWSKVDGGGLLLRGYTYGERGNSFSAVYMDANGDTTVVDSGEVANYGYSWYYYASGQAVRLGDALYIPYGWAGIKKVEL
ncbi:MAG: hypothetical protein C4523_16400 [Myxococcales bacterium]|nr:MAG: hypothetical protein C4523_16400 [Myxococcales bacterium]